MNELHSRSAPLARSTRMHAPNIVGVLLGMLGMLGVGAVADDGDLIRISEPTTIIDRSGRVRLDADLPSSANAAAIVIQGDDLVVDFEHQLLRGAAPETPQDELDGIGVLIEGKNITIRNLRIDGYKVGMLARFADGLTIDGVAVERNFAQRLRSTPDAEAPDDWLWPHRNDDDQWRKNYGAAICVEWSANVTVRNVTVRRSQNGIMLSNVRHGRIHDNDCSFLSGWGLAMWRTSNSVVSRNAFDFCVRGYSHGVYNRGQDSAGILLFEQCNANVFIENSATHGGDGVFGFAGREALGEAPHRDRGDEREIERSWYFERGCNDNVFLRNDFSHAAAHGLELTFSFRNLIAENRFVGNAICGIWAGYSQQTLIVMNRFAENGDRGYGLERGGVNIEHGIDNRIVHNVFQRNRCGVHLWWNAAEPMMRLPWAQVNDTASRDNMILFNRFDGDEVAIHLRDNGPVHIANNSKRDVTTALLADETSSIAIDRGDVAEFGLPAWQQYTAIGETSPVGARRHLAGRDRIIMTEWGPYDWSGPLLIATRRRSDQDTWRVLGDVPVESMDISLEGKSIVVVQRDDDRTISVRGAVDGVIRPYEIIASLADGTTLKDHGVLSPARWAVQFFAWSVDPRDDLAAWRKEADAGVRLTVPALQFPFGGGGPGDLADRLVADAMTLDGDPLEEDAVESLRDSLRALPADRFGTIARTTLRFPAGRWRLRTLSDDGVRVTANGEIVIDNWTWHAPTVDIAELHFDESTTVDLLVEHFELDGHAVLEFAIEAVK